MCSQEHHQDDKFGAGKETSYFPNAVCNRVVSFFRGNRRPAREQRVSAVNSSMNISHVPSLVFYIADLKVLVKKGFNFVA